MFTAFTLANAKRDSESRCHLQSADDRRASPVWCAKEDDLLFGFVMNPVDRRPVCAVLHGRPFGRAGQRMPRLPLFARFPTSSTQRRCCIWRGCTALRRACLARRPELCRRPTLALQRRAVHRSYRHFQGCLSNLKRDKFPRQLLHPNSMRFRSKPYRSLCGTANHLKLTYHS